MNLRALKYGSVFIALGLGFLALYGDGWWSYGLPLFAFVIVPLSELFLKPDPENLSDAEMEVAREDRIYDYIIYLVVPIQWALLIFFFFVIQNPELETFEIVGKTWAMGIGCGVLGINAAHELGHRPKKSEQFMSKALLLTSLYMHFFIEHNRGHHKNVSTQEDPASARRGESLYAFWFRSVTGAWIHAWRLEHDRLTKKNLPVISLHNEMLVFQLIQVAFVTGVFLIFGWLAGLCFLAAATIGFLLLETVNYIEHYGLQRRRSDSGVYERVRPVHSWNANHPIGRILLFELTRHSDHHYRAARPYQLLRHMDNAPQMPTGYPGMMALSFFPPLWFYVMHRHIDDYHAQLSLQA